MANDELIRRDVLQTLAALPFMALLTQASRAHAQVGVSPVKVDTQGLVAKIKFEAPLEGFLKEINGKYKLRITELTLLPVDMWASTITRAPAFARSLPVT